jgi:hypothetical protein
MPTTKPPKRFKPSYDFDTPEDYATQVEICEPFEDIDDWGMRIIDGAPPECKRVKHIMIRGGRKASRYRNSDFSGGVDLTPYVPDPQMSSTKRTRGGGPSAASFGRPEPGTFPLTRPGTKMGEAESEPTTRRLEGLNPIYRRRTQSANIKVSSPYEAKIATAMAKYRAAHSWGLSGFSVPSTISPLVEAGMPPRAATLLVRRAARKWFDEATLADFVGDSLLASLEDKVGAALRLGYDEKADGVTSLRSGKLQGLPIRYLAFKDDEDEIVQERVFMSASLLFDDEEMEPEDAPKIEMLIDSPFSFALNAVGIDQAVQEWIDFNKRATGYYNEKDGNPKFLNLLFSEWLPNVVARHPGTSRISFFFGIRKKSELASPKEFEVGLSAGEHSKFEGMSDEDLAIKYDSLENVALSDLPSVLARLSLAKKRKGRKLPELGSLVRTNPSVNPTQVPGRSTLPELTLEYVYLKAYPASGPAQLVTVPGRPDRVFWPVTKVRSKLNKATGEVRKFRDPVRLKEVDIEQAKSWLGLAEFGRKVKTMAKKVRQPQEQARRAVLSNNSTAGKAVKERSMSDEQYWMDQFSTGPFGATSSIPVVRRNGMEEDEEEFDLAMANPFEEEEEGEDFDIAMENPFGEEEEDVEFSEVVDNPRGFPSVFKRAAKLRAQGHSPTDALKMAWAERKGRKVRKPRAKPTSRRRTAKPTSRRQTAKPRVVQSHDAATIRRLVASRAQQIMASVPGCNLGKAMKKAWREIAGTKTQRRSARAVANPWFHEDGSHLYLPDTTAVRPALVKAPYAWADKTEVRSALVGGRYGSKKAKANPFLSRSPETDMWDHHPIYEQTIGQFSTGEQFTMGFQPMNRRNPGGTMKAVFPGTCVNCGDPIVRGQEIADSGKRGPKGGKKMAHAECC